MFRKVPLILLSLTLASLGDAQQIAPSNPTVGQAPAGAAPVPTGMSTSNSSPAADASNSPTVDKSVALLYAAMSYLKENQLDTAILRVNDAIKLKPTYADAYGFRAALYAKKGDYVTAEKDFQTELQYDTVNATRVRLNLAETQFKQKKYGVARANFSAIQKDLIIGDFAAYKVFLCDLFGGQETVAARELDVFNQAGRNASYHFANAAWDLYHKKPEDARSWLESATNIYDPQKIQLYATPLLDQGYLPLPPPPGQTTQ
jgi:Tfp pilus assembly protein PilF